MKQFCIFLCMLCMSGVAMCVDSVAADTTETIQVFVSIVPQEYFVERIGGDRVAVEALVKPGSSPATYEPTARQIATLAKAKVFFRIGVPFENAFLPKITQTLASLKIVDTRKGITLRTMKAHHHDEDDYADDEHEKHKEHGHQHAGNDPHIWLNPQLVKIQARTIADALIALDPAGKDMYEKNYTAFAADLDALDAKLAAALAPVKGKTFLVFHPAWGYFADQYGLRQEAIELEGKEPGMRELGIIIKQAKAEDVQVIFVQPQFSRQLATKVASAIGGAVVPINPLAREYITNLESVATAINTALKQQKEKK